MLNAVISVSLFQVEIVRIHQEMLSTFPVQSSGLAKILNAFK